MTTDDKNDDFYNYLKLFLDGLNEPTAAWNYNMNLQSVIELCKDSSLLGLKLLDMANNLLGHSNGERRNRQYSIRPYSPSFLFLISQ